MSCFVYRDKSTVKPDPGFDLSVCVSAKHKTK